MRGTNFTNESGKAPSPADGAQSTANDYMNFLIMILNKGMFETKRVLSEASVEEMQKIQTTDLPVKYTPKMTEGFDYGLGAWIMEKDASDKATAVSCPGLYGTWPYVSICRNMRQSSL
jgi:CubicO group peptidase (beta-lactamase class C family)